MVPGAGLEPARSQWAGDFKSVTTISQRKLRCFIRNYGFKNLRPAIHLSLESLLTADVGHNVFIVMNADPALYLK